MRKRWIACCACLIAALAPALGWVEDEQTLMLARTLYANCAQQTDETLYCFGDAICNRVGRAEFGDTLRAVLTQFGQYRTGARYDERTLSAARAMLRGDTGRERIPEGVVYAARRDESQRRYADMPFWRVSGDFVFYYAAA